MSSDPKVSSQDSANTTDGEADVAIIANVIYSTAVAVIAYLLYFILRGRTKWLYTPNVNGKKYLIVSNIT